MDVVVRKEGEKTIIEIMERLEAGKDFTGVLGVTFRDGEKIVQNPDRPYIKDLDSLPFPAHHLWPIDRLKKYGKVMFPLMTSRGCTFWCEFCSAVRMFGRGYRMRSAKNVVDEIEYLVKRYMIDGFYIYDDTFVLTKDYVLELCGELSKRNLGLIWAAETRVNLISKEIVKNINFS